MLHLDINTGIALVQHTPLLHIVRPYLVVAQVGGSLGEANPALADYIVSIKHRDEWTYFSISHHDVKILAGILCFAGVADEKAWQAVKRLRKRCSLPAGMTRPWRRKTAPWLATYIPIQLGLGKEDTARLKKFANRLAAAMINLRVADANAGIPT